MPDLTIHGIPQEELNALEERGARHGRTAEEEARHLLHEAAAEQMLISQLERATRAAEARMDAAAPRNPGSAPPRRRRRAMEPTPGRR